MKAHAASFSLNLQSMIPDLLSRYPQARPILDRHGLRGCGGVNGPHESLGFFAKAHGIDERMLMDEIRQAIAQSPSHARAGAHASSDAVSMSADSIYRRYFLGGIAVVLTAGAVWGAWLLWKIAFGADFHVASVHEVNAHGHAQIFGWVGLFVMGFALQALPRMWHVELPAPQLAIHAFTAMLVGLTVRTVAMALAGAPWALSFAIVGGAVELAAILTVVGILAVAFARRDRREVKMEPYMAFVQAGLGWFAIQAGFSLWHTWMTMAAGSRDELLWYIATYQAPLRDMQIHGLALFMILGVSVRMLPAMFGLPRVGDRRLWTGFVLLVAGVVFEISIFIAYRWTGNHALAGLLLLAWLCIAIGVLIVALPWKLWRPMPTHDRSAKFVRAAYGWLAVSLMMLLLLPVYQLVSGISFSHAYYGATRHAITVGFISLMIMGIAAKVVPTLVGRDVKTLTMLWWPFALVNIGCMLRVGMQILTDWHAGFFSVIGISGTLEVTGLAIWGIHLAKLMLTSQPVRMAGPIPERIEAGHVVADVLQWYPESLAVFERFGFTMLRKPAVRRAMAHRVTLGQVAAMRSVDITAMLDSLNQLSNAKATSGLMRYDATLVELIENDPSLVERLRMLDENVADDLLITLEEFAKQIGWPKEMLVIQLATETASRKCSGKCGSCHHHQHEARAEGVVQ